MIRKSLIALAALTLVGAAHAGTYAVTGSFDGSSTNVLTGTFSFDDAIVSAGNFDGTFDLTELTINFQGQTYTLGQAFDPYVQFEGGTLTGPNAAFTLQSGNTLALQSFFGSSSFTYTVGGTDTLGTLNVTLAGAVPEPSSYALLLGGLGAMGLVARRRKA